ncbi:molybdopterin-dependent oxidoreductase [Immundisolibacter sp.]|uniref:molybdopterin-dependent oxidoreductase n=1 Tax=Immundisolibacter sp. TaxID=1934948 RepID=UPI002B07BCF4|nr:molybdopterin-dependent oxidoreductase [Immundisolibacter sp.]MEA3219982.1 Nitrate reductase [Immundisolibacter sp.]
MTSPVRTTCPYCGVGCGVLATPDGTGGAAIAGDPQHPANVGRLCSKGAALGETLDLDGRLLEPLLHGQPVSWDQALDAVAEGFASVIAEHGPQAVAFYVSGQLLNEDYYVANKLMKGFIGSNNIDTNSRLCMASSVAGHVRAFGADTVPGCYEDLEQCELLLLVGSNTAWCHPVLYQRIRAARAARPGLRVVVIDPRRTPTCDIADLHLPLAPGSDVALFNGLLAALADAGAVDAGYVAAHVDGFDAALAAAHADAPDVVAVAAACGLDPADVQTLFDWFMATDKTVTVYSQGVNQSTAGTDKVNAIINCHLATGRIGRPGMGPLSFTGQPNAMGGREVGGLANALACHLDLANADHRAQVAQFWGGGPIARAPGHKAVDLFRAIEAGQVRAVWIMGTNPLVSLPEADRFRAALAGCELVVVSDCVRHTDTTALAHVLLPALAWGEKSGTVTNSERRLSRQRAFLPPPGQARADWWALCEVGKRLGHAGFGFADEAEVFDEYARLSALAGRAGRDFDISALAGLGRAGFDALEPVQWPVSARQPAGTPRLLGDGQFFTPDRRGRMVAVSQCAAVDQPDADYPLLLNTGRVRDHWHTLTRTGKSARLSAHMPEPRLDLHPDDAARLGVEAGGFARVTSRHGQCVVRAAIDPGQRVGSVFLPMHWSHAFASTGPADALVGAHLDPISGQPEFKHTPVRVHGVSLPWRALLLTRSELRPRGVDYWASARAADCWRHQLAASCAPADSAAWLRELPGVDPAWQWLEYRDSAGAYRAAALHEGRLMLALFSGRDVDWLAGDWLVARFGRELAADERRRLLAGVPGAGGADAGRTVCACFQVGINTLRRGIAEQGLSTPEAIGAALKAGTNCGSCVPELRQLLASAQDTQAA